MQASDYHHFNDQRDQIIQCTGMYGVLMTSEDHYIDIMNEVDKITSTKVKIPQGLKQLFIEGMSNASDHVRRVRNKIIEDKVSRIKGTIYDVNIIEVEVSEDTFIITNYGLPIPIEFYKNTDKYIPELIFGNLNSSSNYFGVRTGAGVNGYGAKLINLFSIEYTIYIVNRLQKKSYLQTWEDRMGKVSEPIIEDINSKGSSSITISAKIRLDLFGLESFTEDIINLFKKITLDTSFSTKIGVKFNGSEYNVSKPEDYLKLYSIDDTFDFISHEMKVDNQSIEAIYFDCIDNKIVSFVNSQITTQHGTHVDTCINALSDYIISINKKFKKEDVSLSKKLLKNNISLIVNFNSTNVQMNSQSKTLFQDKVFQFVLPSSKLKKLEKWNITNHFINLLNSRITKKVSKTDGKNSNRIKVTKGHDAFYAGKKTKEVDRSRPRRLFLDEGDSADKFAHYYFDTLKQGRYYNGSCPMKGKIINPDGKSEIKINDNEQIKLIKQFLGLKEGLDYSDDKNFKTLRYDKLVILTDEDYDGHHICGLIINIFERRFPSLLKRNDFIVKLKTPLVIAEKENRKKLEVRVFFRSIEFENWRSGLTDSEIKLWSFKYNKGLASLSTDEIAQHAEKLKMINLIHDATTPEKINMFFDKKQVNERKEWLKIESQASEEVDDNQKISNFIDNELKDFSYHSIERGIPQLIDGLKISQRQILWTVFNKWTRKQIEVTKHSKQKELSRKVSQLASEVSLFVDYHHGEDSLNKTISRMAQSFVNSNNLPFFYQNGLFGSREDSTPGQPRYIKVKPLWILNYIFREEDEQILEFIKAEDDDKDLHPKYLLPVIPLILINGATGMGIGYACNIPKFNLIDIIDWLISKLSNSAEDETKELTPYYCKFTGNIQVEGSNFYSIGRFDFKSEEEIIISEIPVDFSIQEYKEFLETLEEQGKIISFKSDSSPNKPLFYVQGFDIGLTWDDQIDNSIIKKFKLSSKHSLRQLTLLNQKLIPIEFKSINDILEEFYRIRLPYYQVRKDKIIPKIEAEIQFLKDRIKFIQLVLANKITWKNVPKKKVIEQLVEYNLPIELIKSEFVSFTKEKIEKLKLKIKQEEERLNEVKNKSIESMWSDELFELLDQYSESKLNELSGMRD